MPIASTSRADLRRAAAAGRAVRVQRLDFVADANRRRLSVAVRAATRRRTSYGSRRRRDERLAVQRVDADEVAAQLVNRMPTRCAGAPATIACASRARCDGARARVRDLPFADEPVAIAER